MPLEMNVAGDPQLKAGYAAMTAEQKLWEERLRQSIAHAHSPEVQARRAGLMRQMDANQAEYDRLVAAKQAEIDQLTRDYGQRWARLKQEYDRL